MSDAHADLRARIEAWLLAERGEIDTSKDGALVDLAVTLLRDCLAALAAPVLSHDAYKRGFDDASARLRDAAQLARGFYEGSVRHEFRGAGQYERKWVADVRDFLRSLAEGEA